MNKADGSLYSRSGNVSQSENSSITASDPEDVLVEEQEPSSSGASSATSNEYSAGSSVLHMIRQSCPWAKRRYAPTLESLHDEVMDLFTWLRPTAEEIALRRSVFRRVEAELHMLYPNAQITLIGSVATNMFLPSSDIDISVRMPIHSSNDLNAVAEAFRLLDMFDNVKLLDRTDVPIVKLRHKNTEYSIDISFNRHTSGVKTVSYVNYIKNEFPELEPLTLVLKQFLAHNDLNHPYSGGLSSYGLILMVVAFLKTYSREPWRSTPVEKVPLGLLLFEFLHFYGYKFDYYRYGIRVRGNHSCVVDKELLAKPANEDKCSSVFFIEDPIMRGNNVGKSAYNMMAIKAAFVNANDFLSAALVQCQSDTLLQFYWGPMLSLLIISSPEEVNYRKKQRNTVIENTDVLFRSSNNMSHPVSCCSPTTENNMVNEAVLLDCSVDDFKAERAQSADGIVERPNLQSPPDAISVSTYPVFVSPIPTIATSGTVKPSVL